MTLPRAAAEVLSGHVRLEVRCIDRVLLTFRQPRLQYGQGIHGFFCRHRGNRFVSSSLMLPMTERFAAGIRHYIDTRRLDLVRFARGQSKDQVAREYLAGHDGGECILFAGVAQEKTRVWRTARRRDPVTGKRYPWLYQEQAMAGHWYFYGSRRRLRPVLYQVLRLFPLHRADLLRRARVRRAPVPEGRDRVHLAGSARSARPAARRRSGGSATS